MPGKAFTPIWLVLVHPKMKMSSFTQPHANPNPYDFRASSGHACEHSLF